MPSGLRKNSADQIRNMISYIAALAISSGEQSHQLDCWQVSP